MWSEVLLLVTVLTVIMKLCYVDRNIAGQSI